jgi:hypothetical protein
VDGVVLEHVREIIRIEQVVDADNLDVIGEILNRSAEDHTADTAEAVNTKFNHCLKDYKLLINQLLKASNQKAPQI